MGKPRQPTAAKPTVSKCIATSSTKSYAYTSCSFSTCTYTNSCCTCTFLFYFIGRVGQNDDTKEYAIPTRESLNPDFDKSNGVDG